MTKYQEFLIKFEKNSLIYVAKISLILGIDKNHAKQIIFFYHKKGILTKIYEGFYVFVGVEIRNEVWIELGCRLSSGYLGGEHILSSSGIINADFGQIFTFFSNHKEQEVDLTKFGVQIKICHIASKKLFYSNLGISFLSNYTISGSERAIVDIFYKFGIFLCDNIDLISNEKFKQIIQILPIRKQNELAKYT